MELLLWTGILKILAKTHFREGVFQCSTFIVFVWFMLVKRGFLWNREGSFSESYLHGVCAVGADKKEGFIVIGKEFSESYLHGVCAVGADKKRVLWNREGVFRVIPSWCFVRLVLIKRGFYCNREGVFQSHTFMVFVRLVLIKRGFLWNREGVFRVIPSWCLCGSCWLKEGFVFT